MVGPDNKPVTNEAVYLFARDAQNLTLTTDMKGMASFSLDTALWKDTMNLMVGYFFSELFYFFWRITSVQWLPDNSQFSIYQLYNPYQLKVDKWRLLSEYLTFYLWLLCQQASSRKTEENEPYVANLRRPEYRSAFHQAAAFYSKSRSFLKLMQVNGKIFCDKDENVRAQFIIQGEELKKGQEVLDFFYLVRFMWWIMSYCQYF